MLQVLIVQPGCEGVSELSVFNGYSITNLSWSAEGKCYQKRYMNTCAVNVCPSTSKQFLQLLLS